MRNELTYWRETVLWFVFWRPANRRRVVRFAAWSHCPRRWHDWLLDQLYPLEARVLFPPPPVITRRGHE